MSTTFERLINNSLNIIVSHTNTTDKCILLFTKWTLYEFCEYRLIHHLLVLIFRFDKNITAIIYENILYNIMESDKLTVLLY